MIYSLEINNFGRKMKKVREKLGLSLYDVSDQTGLKRQTISNIERGICIPRLDTLDILSNVYKVNLYKLLDDSRKIQNFTSLYNKIDELITNLNLSNLEQVTDEINQFIELSLTNNKGMANQFELENFKLFIQLLNDVYSSDQVSIEKVNIILNHLDIEDLSLLNDEFLDKRNFTFIEYRILMVISMLLIDFKKYDEGILILNYCLNNVTNFVFDETREMHLRLKIYLNLSYLHFTKKNHSVSLDYANKGIELATERHSSYLLSQLFARRAVAKLKTNQARHTIEEDYIKSIALFYINDNYSLASQYIDIFNNHYQITVDTLNKLKEYINK